MHPCLKCINNETIGFYRPSQANKIVCYQNSYTVPYTHTYGSAELYKSMDKLYSNCPKIKEHHTLL